jgi:predicted amidohydrolase YtcJ
MKMRQFFLLMNLLFFFHPEISAQMKPKADLIILNAKIYTVDEDFRIAEALAVKEGKFIEIGNNADIQGKYDAGSVIDAGGMPVYPGFIDAHCHFYGYALSLQQIDLTHTNSFEEVLTLLQKKSADIPGKWLVGRGWDHNKWPVRIFPDRSKLDSLFPDRPVVLIRIDGHVLLANSEALNRGGFGSGQAFNPGEVEIKHERLSGILSENAADKMRNAIPEPDHHILAELLAMAQRNCFAVGLTGVADAGLEYYQVKFIDSLQKSGKLKMYVYGMLSPTAENIDNFIVKGKYQTSDLNIRSVKLYADGSLGSRTALLTKPYSDDPDNNGILANPVDYIRRICQIAYKNGYQVNTHAIGDSAVRIVCKIYQEFLKEENDLRWRVEHSQVVDPNDLALFGKYSIIPSIQATHATSDMYWAGERLGKERIKWAYAYKSLLDQNGWIINGTDFPIENISPLFTFYASVTRKDLKGMPLEGFQIENALSRSEALKSITIWAAKGCFEETSKGSIEKGKSADFVILDKDIMTIPESEMPGAMVNKLFIGGVKVYEK